MKGQLARKLSQIEDFREPKISLEQYITPAELASDLLHTAFLQEDIEGKEIADLGTGTGMFAIGAALLGGDVIAIDKDSDALDIARENAEKLEMIDFIEFREKDVADFEESVDTVFMNPPFSVHSEEAMTFVKTALNSADTVYTVAHPKMVEGIKEFVENSEHVIEAVEEYEIMLPSTYGFHKQQARKTAVNVVITRRK